MVVEETETLARSTVAVQRPSALQFDSEKEGIRKFTKRSKWYTLKADTLA